MDETTERPVEVDESWKNFSSDPTPLVSFSKEIKQEVDGEILHVWIRLPNPFQHRKVHEHAAAARARMVMQLKDPESDASMIIEEQISETEDLTDDDLIEWLLGRHATEAIFAAQVELDHLEETGADGNSYRPWDGMTSHQERYAIMLERSEVESDEFKKLEAHIMAYAEAIQERANFYLEPKHEAYSAMDREGRIEKIRRALKHARCTDEFINVYNQWQIFYGTRDPVKQNKLYFEKFTDLLDAEGGCVELLTEEFAHLDALKAGELGKSPRATSLLASLERYEN